MFRKKPAPEPQRPRQRVVQSDVPRNTAVFSSYHANRAVNLDGRGRAVLQEQARPKRTRVPAVFSMLKRQHVMSVLVIIILFLLTIGLDTTPNVVVVGETKHRFALQDVEVYQQYAHEALGKSLANNNKLTIDADAVAQKIEQHFPEVHAASVSLPFIGRKPTLYIQPATPQLILATQNGQFILDASGRALAVSNESTIPDDTSVPTVSDKSGLPGQKGQVLLPRSSVTFITEISRQLAQKQIRVENWTLPAGTNQLDTKVKGTPYYVKFNLQGDGREQAGTFLALQKHLGSERTTPSQYIDVRVPGRAYYR